MQNFKTKVLLVEDEELARKTLAFYLNTIFDEVITACDGSEALEIIDLDADGLPKINTDDFIKEKNGEFKIDFEYLATEIRLKLYLSIRNF